MSEYKYTGKTYGRVNNNYSGTGAKTPINAKNANAKVHIYKKTLDFRL